jgi:thiamine biosynthesis lipoprotein
MRVERFRSMGCDVVVGGAGPGEPAAVRALFERRDAIFSRFRAESELLRVNASSAELVTVSPEFAELVEVALDAARATRGLVTPTVGAAVTGAGYDRDFSQLRPDKRAPIPPVRVPDWRCVSRVGRVLRRPPGVQLDLNGVVKGRTVDDALALLADGGFVSAGGDLAATCPLEVELPDGRAVSVRGGGFATSAVTRRRWLRGGIQQHHLIDPATGAPSSSLWACVSVAAGSCLAADVAAKAALLQGASGPDWLDRRGVPGRFVDPGGHVVSNRTWRRAVEPTRDDPPPGTSRNLVTDCYLDGLEAA